MALLGLGFLAACLSDQGYTDIVNKVDANTVVVSMGEGEYGYGTRQIEILPELDVPVKITVANAKADITVSLAVSQAALDDYNAEQKEEAIQRGDTLPDGTVDPAKYQPYLLLPETHYTLPPANVVVPAGTLDTDYVIKVNSTTIDLTKKYLLPIVITGVSNGATLASNARLNQALLGIVVKNKYDGNYVVDGSMVDYSAASLTGYYPWKVALVTEGADRVSLWDRENIYSAGPSHIILSGGSYSRYGSFAPVFIFDSNNNVTSVINYYGQPSSNGRTAELDPSGVNKWDPATKTLKVKYWMNQPSVITPHRTLFDQTYTFKGSR